MQVRACVLCTHASYTRMYIREFRMYECSNRTCMYECSNRTCIYTRVNRLCAMFTAKLTTNVEFGINKYMHCFDVYSRDDESMNNDGAWMHAYYVGAEFTQTHRSLLYVWDENAHKAKTS